MRETEILVEQQPPQGVLVCDHAGRVIDKFSLNEEEEEEEETVSTIGRPSSMATVPSGFLRSRFTYSVFPVEVVVEGYLAQKKVQGYLGHAFQAKALETF